MANYRNIIEGLQVLAACEKHGLDAFNVDAEHDILYAGPTFDEPALTPEINAKMEALGWHRSDADRWAIYT